MKFPEGLADQIHAATSGARFGIAVSGGGDSLALMLALAEEFPPERFIVATVDHGLRPESANEAQNVARLAQSLGIEHHILTRDTPIQGNLQGAARAFRYDALTKWANALQLTHILLGHTATDQAETFLINLARGSGLDGLSAMPAVKALNGVHWHRPLLPYKREELRLWLEERGVSWVDDPSNEDTQFDRIKFRKALPKFDALGLNIDRMNQAVAHLQNARTALSWSVAQLWERCVSVLEPRIVALNPSEIQKLPEEYQHRLLLSALQFISGETYKPRKQALLDFWAHLRYNKEGRSLSGCLARPHRNRILIYREFAALEAPKPATDIWEGWKILPNESSSGLEIRPIGANGLKLIPDWRAAKMRFDVAVTLPSLWEKETLCSVPHLGFGQDIKIFDTRQPIF